MRVQALANLVNQLVYHRDFWLLLPGSLAILCCGTCLTCGIFGLLLLDIEFYEFVSQNTSLVSLVVLLSFCCCLVISIVNIVLILVLGVIARYWLRQDLVIPKTEQWPYIEDNAGDSLDESPIDLSKEISIDITSEVSKAFDYSSSITVD